MTQSRPKGGTKDRPETIGYRILALVGDLSTRYNLTVAQKAFLTTRWRFKSDAEAARSLGFKPRTVERWKTGEEYADGRKLSAFSEAYDDYFKGFDLVIQGEVEGLLGKVVTRIDEMLDAEKVWVGQGGVEMRAPDHESRFKGVQAVLNYLGRWGQRKQVDITTNYIDASEEFAKLLQQKRLERERVIEGEVVGRG